MRSFSVDSAHIVGYTDGALALFPDYIVSSV
jgi:hypothetical protein